MRILISIVLLLAGFASVAYSYVGTFVALFGELEQSTSVTEVYGLASQVIGMMAEGQIPQLPGFLAAGVLMIVIAVLTLFGLIGKRSVK